MSNLGFDPATVDSFPTRWRVERSDTISIPLSKEEERQYLPRWWAFPDDDTDDLDRGFPTWREAFDYATRMAHQ